tara:strand:+ start:1526 stop:1753 length:228 start_codon:yes stop_codon:yes gene_type:complete
MLSLLTLGVRTMIYFLPIVCFIFNQKPPFFCKTPKCFNVIGEFFKGIVYLILLNRVLRLGIIKLNNLFIIKYIIS